MQPEADPATPPDDALDRLLVAAERLQGVRGRSAERRGDLDQAHIRWRPLRADAGGERTVAEIASTTELQLDHDSSTNALIRRYRKLRAVHA